MPKQIISLSSVVKLISEQHGVSSGDVYAQLREAIESGVLEQEGIEVFEQPTAQGKHGKTHHFNDCAKVVAVWSDLYLASDVAADALLVEIRDAVDNNKQLRLYFPNFLYRKLLKHLSDKSSKVKK